MVRAADALRACASTRRPQPSLVNMAISTGSAWPLSVCKHLPDSLSQILAVRSYDAVTTHSPIGENVAHCTMPKWPSRVIMHSCCSCRCRNRQTSQLSVSQSFAVQSREEVSSRSPSGEKAAVYTVPLWPESVRIQLPSAVFHTLALWSLDVVTTCSRSA